MKKVLTICFVVAAFLFSLTLTAKAADKKSTIGGEVSLSYWPAKVNVEGDSAKQNFLPALTASIDVADSWSAVVEYDTSGSKAVSPADPPTNTKLKSTQYLIGVKHGYQGGGYVTLSYEEYKFKMSTMDNSDGTIKFDGFRIGGGITKDFAKTPWSASFDLGFGIANKAKVSVAAGSLTSNADRCDASAKGSYKIGTTGLKADLGYRYIGLKTTDDAIFPSTTFTIKGPFIGVTYGF